MIEDYSADGVLAKQLKSGLKELNVETSENQQQQLLELLQVLYKWNKAYNLTAIKQPKEGLKLHLLDSLTLFERFKELGDNKTILDVGTGPGFPGLPLAILFPHLKFTLLDSNSKKIRFIRQTIHQLGLDNVEPIHSRVESFEDRNFDVILSRAFASLVDMVNLTHTLLDEKGIWLAMKGELMAQEAEELPPFVVNHFVTQVEVPNVVAKRCIVELGFIPGYKSEDK
ncbi:MAG: 16S rRNA (guanine(527)-N(7))-methyltransferase RsmG [Kangiella sp.]|nr:MAG: 16S rRNA (guanine(527)-N(7))-methyltransferase RsmG [Kangiella sp.]